MQGQELNNGIAIDGTELDAERLRILLRAVAASCRRDITLYIKSGTANGDNDEFREMAESGGIIAQCIWRDNLQAIPQSAIDGARLLEGMDVADRAKAVMELALRLRRMPPEGVCRMSRCDAVV